MVSMYILCATCFLLGAFSVILYDNVKEVRYDGEFVIEENPEKDIFKLQLNDLNIYDKKELVLKVVNGGDEHE